MSDSPLLIWARFRSWLSLLLHTAAHRIDHAAIHGLDTGEWTLVPVHDSDIPGGWVSMTEPAYRALILFGYSYPEGEEPDWDLEPSPDLEDETLAAIRQEGLDAMRETIRQRIAFEESL